MHIGGSNPSGHALEAKKTVVSVTYRTHLCHDLVDVVAVCQSAAVHWIRRCAAGAWRMRRRRTRWREFGGGSAGVAATIWTVQEQLLLLLEVRILEGIAQLLK